MRWFQGHKEKIAGYLGQFNAMFTDEDFPWDEGLLKQAGHLFTMACVDAFE